MKAKGSVSNPTIAGRSCTYSCEVSTPLSLPKMPISVSVLFVKCFKNFSKTRNIDAKN